MARPVFGAELGVSCAQPGIASSSAHPWPRLNPHSGLTGDIRTARSFAEGFPGAFFSILCKETGPRHALWLADSLQNELPNWFKPHPCKGSTRVRGEEEK